MSQTAEQAITIINTAGADVAQNNGTWYNVNDCDKVLFQIDIVGTADAKIDLDPMGGNSAGSTLTYSANNSYVLDDPAGQIRAWSNGVAANESVTVKMRRIYFNRR